MLIMDTSRKIHASEVAIISAGEQIRKKILGTGQTIEEFAREISLYPVSVKQYLRREDGGSATFKIKLTHYFNQNYHDIVKEPQQQLQDICRILSENIHLYTSSEDTVILNKAHQMVLDYQIESQIPWMDRNIALNLFYQNSVNESLRLLTGAIEQATRLKSYETQVVCATDLALVQYYRCEYEKALQWIESALLGLSDIKYDNKMAFLIFFRKGIILSRMKAYGLSDDSFQNALSVAQESTFLGVANLHRAETLFKAGKTDKAKECYHKALEALEDDPLRQSFVYNSFSNMLLEIGDHQRAQYFSEKAMTCCNNDSANSIISFQHFETFAKISIRTGSHDRIHEQLIHMVERASNDFVYRDQILDAVRILTECYESLNTIQTRQLESLIMQLIEKTAPDEINYRKELKSLLGEVILRNRKYEKHSI